MTGVGGCSWGRPGRGHRWSAGAVFEVAEVVDCGLAGPPGAGGVADAGPVDCVRAKCPAPTAEVSHREGDTFASS